MTAPSCDSWKALLAGYLYEDLDPASRSAVEAHLAGCARCQAMVTDFRILRGVAANLERRTPPEHVWTQLAARLHREDAPLTAARAVPTPARGWRPALAGVFMLALLAGGSWFAWREVAAVRTPPPAMAMRAPGMEALDTEILNLLPIVNAGAEVLPDQTKEAYQVNDAVIEHAIGESRAALATEPMNNLAQQSLFEATRSKLVLLQDMVPLINEMRKGNQDGAARIVSRGSSSIFSRRLR